MIPLLSIANIGRYASLALVVPGLPCYLAVANGSPIDWLWSLNWRRNSVVPLWNSLFGSCRSSGVGGATRHECSDGLAWAGRSERLTGIRPVRETAPESLLLTD
jgi:hypothetical protein